MSSLTVGNAGVERWTEMGRIVEVARGSCVGAIEVVGIGTVARRGLGSEPLERCADCGLMRRRLFSEPRLVEPAQEAASAQAAGSGCDGAGWSGGGATFPNGGLSGFIGGAAGWGLRFLPSD